MGGFILFVIGMPVVDTVAPCGRNAHRAALRDAVGLVERMACDGAAVQPAAAAPSRQYRWTGNSHGEGARAPVRLPDGKALGAILLASIAGSLAPPSRRAA